VAPDRRLLDEAREHGDMARIVDAVRGVRGAALLSPFCDCRTYVPRTPHPPPSSTPCAARAMIGSSCSTNPPAPLWSLGQETDRASFFKFKGD
jgi:hypothetical protein